MCAMNFKVNDLVWAKMKGYPPWPGKLVVPPPEAKIKAKKNHYVFFFGSNNFAWIPEKYVELHNDLLVEKYKNNKKGGVIFQSAVEMIIKYSKGVSKYRVAKHKICDNEDTLSKDKDHENKSDKSKTDQELQSNGISRKNKLPMKKLSAPKKSAQFLINQSSLPNSALRKFKKKLPVKNLWPVKKLTVTKMPGKKSTLTKMPVKKSTYSDHFNFMSFANNFKQEDIIASSSNLSKSLVTKHFDENKCTPIVPNLKSKMIRPTVKKIGFLGFGKIGQQIVENLHQSGHILVVWNQTPEKCQLFANKFNIEVANTPIDVFVASDIIFSCLSDADAVKHLYFGTYCISHEMSSFAEKKDYVEMTPIDPDLSGRINSLIRYRGGRYLEAPVRLEYNEGSLLILAAGDKTLYDDCKSCFHVFSNKHVFVGDTVGKASILSIVHNMLTGAVCGAVAESLLLVSRVGFKEDIFIEILKNGFLNCNAAVQKGVSMIKNEYIGNTTLKNVHKDLTFGVSLANKFSQRSPIFAAAKEVYKRCGIMGYDDCDVSSIYEATKP